ncbi:MAG TPA: protein phosphatase 2C domain-containing protein [Bryobacteraceae bacterium]|nr:protein phosphatase 2C domain-containing protein [Bryobacteraceae bacterium]
MRFLPGNAQHIGARHSQQDSFGFADPDDVNFIQHGGFLAVVCDGMGGMEHGDLAGRTAVRAFLDAYGRKTPQEPVPAALDRSVREANARVVALAHSLGRAEGIGTTLVAATLLDGGPGLARLYWVSVGDSGLFQVSGGQMRMVNYPHVFANHLDQAVRRGTMSVEAAMTHPERESLTSFIGAEVLEEIDLTPEPLMLAEGDTILLASDGMFKTLSPAEITACLTGDPQGWPETLVQQTLARRKESQDNVTVLSVTVEGEPVNVSPQSGSFVRPAEFAAPVLPEVQAAEQMARTVRIPVEEVATPAPAEPPQMGFVPAPAPPPLAATDMVNTGWPPPAPTPSPGQPPVVPSALAPAGPPGQASAVPEGMGMTPGAHTPARGRGWTWVLVLILLLGAGGGGWWYWSHWVQAGGTGLRRNAAPADKTPPQTPPHDADRPIPPPDPNAPNPFSQPDAKQPQSIPGGAK